MGYCFGVKCEMQYMLQSFCSIFATNNYLLFKILQKDDFFRNIVAKELKLQLQVPLLVSWKVIVSRNQYI